MRRPRVPRYRPRVGAWILVAAIAVDLAVDARAFIVAPAFVLVLLWSVYEGR